MNPHDLKKKQYQKAVDSIDETITRLNALRQMVQPLAKGLEHGHVPNAGPVIACLQQAQQHLITAEMVDDIVKEIKSDLAPTITNQIQINPGHGAPAPVIWPLNPPKPPKGTE